MNFLNLRKLQGASSSETFLISLIKYLCKLRLVQVGVATYMSHTRTHCWLKWEVPTSNQRGHASPTSCQTSPFIFMKSLPHTGKLLENPGVFLQTLVSGESIIAPVVSSLKTRGRIAHSIQSQDKGELCKFDVTIDFDQCSLKPKENYQYSQKFRVRQQHKVIEMVVHNGKCIVNVFLCSRSNELINTFQLLCSFAARVI